MTKPYKPTKKDIAKKLKEAVIILNDIVNVKLAPSPIHGIGVFALKNIKKGQKLYLDAIPNAFDLPFKRFKELNKEVAEILLGHWPQIVNGSHFLYPVTKFTAFLNHTETANYDAKKDIAVVDIKAGDEITENYREIESYKKVFNWLK